MTWPHNPRPAASLIVLRNQVDILAPNRSKASDGMVGDEHHTTRTSDHNPHIVDSSGTRVVSALDITHDPLHGCNSYTLAETLRKEQDRRIKYVISNGKIFSSTLHPWTWRPYLGTNKHAHHMHISVRALQPLYDSEVPWAIYSAFPVNKPPSSSKPPPPPPTIRRGSMGEAVMQLQALLGARVDGIFGAETDSLLRTFQRRHGLKVDGIVGGNTWTSLLNNKEPSP